jgi:hypothetical protein
MTRFAIRAMTAEDAAAIAAGGIPSRMTSTTGIAIPTT